MRLSLLVLPSLLLQADAEPSRGVVALRARRPTELLAQLYPDRPWEGAPKPTAADAARKLEQRLAQLEIELVKSQGQLRRSQSELLEAQQRADAQHQAKVGRLAWHERFLSQRASAEVYAQLGLHSFVGVVAASCMLAGRSVPALVCLLCAIAGGAIALSQLVAAAVKAFHRRWGDLRPERQVACYQCARVMGVPKGSTEVVCPHCGAMNKVTKSFY